MDCSEQLPIELLVCFTGNAFGYASATKADDTLLVYMRIYGHVLESENDFRSTTQFATRASRSCSDNPLVFYRDGNLQLTTENEHIISNNVKYLKSRVCKFKPRAKTPHAPSNVLITYNIASEDNNNQDRTLFRPDVYSITRVKNTVVLTDVCLPDYMNIHHWCISVSQKFNLTENEIITRNEIGNITSNTLLVLIEVINLIQDLAGINVISDNPDIYLHSNKMKPRSHGCPSHTSQFTCDDGHCVSHSQVLDDYEDCPDGSDEDINSFPCLKDQTSNHFSQNCGKLYFACGDLLFIDWRYVCDGQENCKNGTDEFYCSNIPVVP